MKLFKKKIRFDQRLFFYFFIIFLAFTTIVTIFQYQREKKFRTEQLELQLSDYNTIIYNFIQEKSISHEDLDSLVYLLPDSLTRVTIINKQGIVEYDSYVSQEKDLENHLNRDEIQSSITNNRGSAIRNSASTGIDYYYVANNYPNYFIRSALPYDLTLDEMLDANPMFFYFMFIMFIVTVVSLIQISNRIGKSISQLRDFAQSAEHDTEINSQQKFTNDELGEISAYIVEIYNRLRSTKNDLYKEREKLYQHLQIAQEGVAIFSTEKKEIISNSNFLQYFDMLSDIPLGSANDVFTIPELSDINKFINSEISTDNKNEMQGENLQINKNGYSFIIQCIVFQDNNFEISINDITQQERQNQLKRQLTQNISHELKTPVSSIQGYMETIIQNPNIDDEKRQFFIERSHQQSIRLSQLLQDISQLNKIDEANNLFEKEIVYVNEVIADVLNDVSLELEKKKIRIDNQLKEVIMIKGNRSLLYSIFRNLIDNSILHAGENLDIVIQCYREDDDAFNFSYYDTGIGVDEEHLQLLFDRFYRADQGRSRKMGGTGLGLAIVKNAILFHNGKITARNRPEGGLEFLFNLEKKSS